MADEISLWSDSVEDDKEIIVKTKSPKKVVKKSAKVRSLEDKLVNIRNEVYKILGKHAEDTVVISSKEEYLDYIRRCISFGICAVDTETNNSTEPITCKLMGLCLYVPGMKQAYIPVNHIDRNTGIRLGWQLTEEDIAEGLRMLVDSHTRLVFHNATFDIRVLQCTCGVELTAYWDTRVGCRTLDENESQKDGSKLKFQYVLHVDPHHGKYDIESLFEGLSYAIIDPDLFALYAATDSMMTFKLYEYQKAEFEKEGNKRLYALFMEVEMPEIRVVKNIELAGISIDEEYWGRVKNKYDRRLEDVNRRISVEIEKLQPVIDAWRKTPEANQATERKGKDGKVVRSKSKAEQLEDPVNLGSPPQFAILLYDILKAPVVDKEKPRGTGEEIIDAIYEQTGLEICRLLIERRGYTKLLSTYIDNIPVLLNIWKDGKIRAGFDQNGTDTGRFTSGGKIKMLIDGKKEEIPGINLQTIPSHNKEIRMLYKAKVEEHSVEIDDDFYSVPIGDEVRVGDNEWIKSSELKPGMTLPNSDGNTDIIKDIIISEGFVKIYV